MNTTKQYGAAATEARDLVLPSDVQGLSGAYNLPAPGTGYPVCIRAVQVMFPYQPGQTVRAKATLIHQQVQPYFVVQLSNGTGGNDALFRQHLNTEPPSKFQQHAYLNDDGYPLNSEVDVEVQVVAQGNDINLLIQRV